MTACQNSSYTVSSAMENDQFVGKRNASRIPLRRPSPASTLMSPTGSLCPGSTPVAQYDSYRSKNSRNKQDRGDSEKARCSQSEILLYHQRLSRPDVPMPRVWKSAASQNWTSAPTGLTKDEIIIIIEEVMVIIGTMD